MIQLLADNNFGDTRGDGIASPIGLVIILLLAIATALLIRNMNSRLRRLPERFEQPPPPPRLAGSRADRQPATGPADEGDPGDPT